MSDGRRPSKKIRFRSDGSSIWTKRNIDGPGIWVTCVKGKEKQTVGEIYELFGSLADEFWPSEEKSGDNAEHENAENDLEEEIEKSIAKEVEKMKRPRRGMRFSSIGTDTPCREVLFISCKAPVDVVKLVESYMNRIEKSGVTHTRFTQRLVPMAASCDATLLEMVALCKRAVVPFFHTEEDKSYRYKIELRMRNHNTITRDEAIKAIAQCIPERHEVDLSDPELFILVEVFKSVCGMSVVRDYYRYKKFNVNELTREGLAKEGLAKGACYSDPDLEDGEEVNV